MRYLLFGSSSTFGEVDYENGGWAGHLRKYLDIQEKHRFFHNLAISGNTSKDIFGRIEAETKVRLRNKPKEEWTMFLSLGTNDSRLENGEPKVSEDEYRNNVKQIFAIAKNLVGKVILVSGNPVIEEVCNPWKGRDCYFLNERIKKYGTITKELADAENIPVIDVYTPLEAYPNLKELYEDGLHPNAKGHEIIFKEIKKFLEKQ